MKIGLYGIYGLYNYGCEAIVRGAYDIIKRINPKAKIIYFSFRAEEDKKIINDLDIEIVQLSDDRRFLTRATNVLFTKVQIPYRIGKKSYDQVIESVDVVFSIGGDLYTIPAYLRKQDRYFHYNNIVQFGRYAIAHGKKIIVFGASVGPFGDYKPAKRYYLNHLQDVDLIIAREEKCIEYLRGENIEKNVVFMPDPAFAVRLENSVEEEKKYIGINISPLSLSELYGAASKEKMTIMAGLISKLQREVGYEVMMVPHVMSPESEEDNDFIFMKRIWELLPEEVKKNVVVTKPGSFLEAKLLLRKCKMLISARMHCAINAICENVPTLLLSYSDKSKGMARFVYGNDDWCIALDNIENELVPMAKEMIEQENAIKDRLKNRNQEILCMFEFGESKERLERNIT